MQTIDRQDIIPFLNRIWAFRQMESEHIEHLAAMIRVRYMTDDQVLWLQGQTVEFFCMVYEGKIRSLRMGQGGQEKLLNVLERGWHFGLAEMITGEKSTVTLRADGEAVLLTLDQQTLRRELLSNAEICYRLMRTMARAIFHLTNELERASFEHVSTRLARLLLRQEAMVYGSVGTGKDKGEKHRSCSHEELAALMGVSRETVSRTLSVFRKQGLIETAYRKIKIIDRQGLASYLEEKAGNPSND